MILPSLALLLTRARQPDLEHDLGLMVFVMGQGGLVLALLGTSTLAKTPLRSGLESLTVEMLR